jgi:hypothetical protein
MSMDHLYKNIHPEALKHSDFLVKLSKSLEIPPEDAKRLRDIASGLRFRPELDMVEDFRFEVGKVYPTREGKLVKIIEDNGNRFGMIGYECVCGDDGESYTDEKGNVHVLAWRYNRSTGTYDAGRCTGSPDDKPRNLLPIEITDERVLSQIYPTWQDNPIEYLIPCEIPMGSPLTSDISQGADQGDGA